MRRILTLAVFFYLTAMTAHADRTRGAWHLSERSDGRMQFQMSSERSNNSSPIDPKEFTGLTTAQRMATTETPVDFTLRRDAGTIHFTGTFVNGDGVGRFTFEPNRSFEAAVRSAGVKTEGDDFDDDHLFSLALFDVSSSFIREMQSMGINADLDEYVAFRIHGASPAFARTMRDLGYKLDADQLVAFRIHGVTPEFVRGMRDLGVRDLDADNLVALRIHGATVDFVRDLRDLGYRDVDADDLVAMRIHGVTTSYIRKLADAGYEHVPIDKLVAMKIHGIDEDFVRRTH